MEAAPITVETPSAAGARYLSIARVCDKLSRKKSWIYAKLKEDPTFPRPVLLGTWPVFVESQIDEWVTGQATRQAAKKPRAPFRRKAAA